MSNFINEATERLIVQNDVGEVIKNARKVRYPDSKGDL